MNFDQILDSRRSYRNLRPVPLSEATIHKLISAASLAPSCNNNQPWRFACVKAEAKLQELFEAYSRGNVWVQKASMVIAVYTKEDLDCIIKTRNYFLFDTGIATAFLMLKATELGLVAHPIAGFKPSVVKRILGINPEMQVIALVVVGKHDTTLAEKPRPVRLNLAEISNII
jgi:nitroreductase